MPDCFFCAEFFDPTFFLVCEPVIPPGTDWIPRPTRKPKWEKVKTVVVHREPVLQTIIVRQRQARDMRLEQERLAAEAEAEKQAAIQQARDRVQAERDELIKAMDRKERAMANLALAQLAREKKAKADAERLAEINRKRMENLKKARRAKRKK